MNESAALPSLSVNTEPLPNRTQRFNFWRYFWLTFLVISLAYAWYCFYAPTNKIVWVDNFVSAQKQSAITGKPILLYFTGKWCVPCRIMKRQVWADQEVEALVNAQFIPLSIDLDSPYNAELLTRYNVRGAPVVIVTDPLGYAMRWRAGGMGKSEFLEFLREPKPLDGD